MKYNLYPVDSMVDQVKGNTRFLQRIIFSRAAIVTAGVISAIFLIAAITTN